MKTILKQVKVGVNRKGTTLPTTYYSVILPMSCEILEDNKIDKARYNRIAESMAINYVLNTFNLTFKSYDIFVPKCEIKDLGFVIVDVDWKSLGTYNKVLKFGCIDEVEYDG